MSVLEHENNATTIAFNDHVHLSIQYPMVKGLSHTPPLLFATLVLSRSDLLIMSLLSDHELKLTLSILPVNLNVSLVICVSQSFISCVVG